MVVMVVMVAGILLLPWARAPLSLIESRFLVIGWLGRTIFGKEKFGNVAKQKACQVIPYGTERDGAPQGEGLKVDLDGALERQGVPLET